MMFQVTFEPMGPSRICHNVQIIDDELSNEPDELFSVALVNANPVGVFGASESCITITDNDSKPNLINVKSGNNYLPASAQFRKYT